ncbi:hypothetical protein [Hymenobacter negativus]|uniref:Uncharacterized protein n=1 Tax=Hymenobacter negativus TaxID=2795026 RepID=A0ABS3QC47_9BACT|nr:hypothetical protein [Hymenobacter negativus]MBO2008822.1 hypothetical protein [Hymenobacter negativus]
MNPFLSLVSLLSLALLTPARPTVEPLITGDNSITLVKLNQPPCKTLSAADVLTAKVAYHIADAEQSADGFAVSIKFQGTDPHMTFSVGQQGKGTDVTARQDTLTLTYPMAAIMQNQRLQRPVTCYFYLHRNLGHGRSAVIARTPPIVFQNCQ